MKKVEDKKREMAMRMGANIKKDGWNSDPRNGFNYRDKKGQHLKDKK